MAVGGDISSVAVHRAPSSRFRHFELCVSRTSGHWHFFSMRLEVPWIRVSGCPAVQCSPSAESWHLTAVAQRHQASISLPTAQSVGQSLPLPGLPGTVGICRSQHKVKFPFKKLHVRWMKADRWCLSPPANQRATVLPPGQSASSSPSASQPV